MFIKFSDPIALVLVACAPATTPVEPTEVPMEEPSNTIVDIAVGNHDFSTLVTAVSAAGLVDALSGEGPFTVFAPTDDVFAKLPAGTVESLLLPENKQKLTDILLYHIISGKVLAEDVVTMSEAETVLDQNVTITVKEGKVFIDDSEVIITAFMTSNGVIHGIDAVALLS